MTCVELPWPSRAMSPNARAHWARKHRAAKDDRAAGFFITASSVRRVPDDRPLPVRITLHPPRRGINWDNQIAMTKALMDGVADGIGVPDEQWDSDYIKGEPVKGGKVVVRL